MGKRLQKIGQGLAAIMVKLRRFAEDDRYEELRKNIAAALLMLLVLAIPAAIAIVWKAPHYWINRLDPHNAIEAGKRVELEDDYRKTLAQIVLSVFGLLLLYLTWRRARAGDATVRIMEQGHITDRFTKAIEQLGKLDGDKPNIEVRLGAIYALERIAIDSARDHWTIMEILTAYVRQNAPFDADRPYVEGEKPRTDIQAILTVLGRRKTGPQRERPDLQLDLSNSRLFGAALSLANLRGQPLAKPTCKGHPFTEPTCKRHSLP
jgi:hypothetical protein